VTILERIVNRELVVIQRKCTTPAVLERGVYNFPEELRQMSWRGSLPRKEQPDLTKHLLSFKHKSQLCDLARRTLTFTAQVYARSRKVVACEGSNRSQAAQPQATKSFCLSPSEPFHQHLCLSLLSASPL